MLYLKNLVFTFWALINVLLKENYLTKGCSVVSLILTFDKKIKDFKFGKIHFFCLFFTKIN